MSDVVYRGTLTRQKLKELAAEHLELKDVPNSKDADYNPHKSPYVISIIRQDDGNYIGEVQKNGAVVSARQADPQIVLQMLITHP